MDEDWKRLQSDLIKLCNDVFPPSYSFPRWTSQTDKIMHQLGLDHFPMVIKYHLGIEEFIERSTREYARFSASKNEFGIK